MKRASVSLPSPVWGAAHRISDQCINPKTTIFIVSLFMQVVQPQTPLVVQIGYGAFIALAHALVWCGGALLLHPCGAGPTAGGTPLDRSGVGGLLVGFGMLLALTQQTR